MAGVKGRSGGPRENSGGKRPGAGKKQQPSVPAPATLDMLDFLQQVALGKIDASPVQVTAAKAAVAYTHAKLGQVGKKEAQQEAAEKVSGRFASARQRLVLVKK